MGYFDYKKFIIKQFLKCVSAVDAAKLIGDNLRIDEGKFHVFDKVYNINNGNIYVVGFGKAVLGMASQCEKILGSRLKRGIICMPEKIENFSNNNSEFSLKLDSVIEIYEGAKNNLPDEKAEKGATAIVHLIKSLNPANDNLIVLISGGGSALLPKPKPGITLAEKLNTKILLKSSGADICELNTVQKKLSLVKGGGLACLSYPVNTICLILSDVINDPLDVIASGPTVPNSDATTAAFDVLVKYNLQNKVPLSVFNATKEISSTFNIPLVNEGYPHVNNFVIGNNLKALLNGKQYAEALDFKTLIISRKVKGSVENVSNFYLNLALNMLTFLRNNEKNNTLIKDTILKYCDFELEDSFIDNICQIINDPEKPKKICLISGGEITLKVQGEGKGGRCQELALVFSIKIHELKTKYPDLFSNYNVMLLAAGTDGIDGPTDAAGALAEADVINNSQKLNLDANDYLLKNDSYNFFQKVNNGSHLIKIGPTGTNVMDIYSFIIYEK